MKSNTNQIIRAQGSFIQTYTAEEQEFLAEMARIREENDVLQTKIEE